MSENFNPFAGQGKRAFEQNGQSSQERTLDKDLLTVSFRERAEKLAGFADIAIRQQRLVNDIKRHLAEIGGIDNLTADDCERFAEEHGNDIFEGPAVLAIAMKLQKEHLL